MNGKKVKVATIDTMLSFYLAFLYANKPYYDENKILCMAEYLFDVQSKNRLKQKGLLRRFTINCYGKQHTKEDILGEKAEKFKKLKNKKDTKEYVEWFLRYIPGPNSDAEPGPGPNIIIEPLKQPKHLLKYLANTKTKTNVTTRPRKTTVKRTITKKNSKRYKLSLIHI